MASIAYQGRIPFGVIQPSTAPKAGLLITLPPVDKVVTKAQHLPNEDLAWIPLRLKVVYLDLAAMISQCKVGKGGQLITKKIKSLTVAENRFGYKLNYVSPRRINANKEFIETFEDSEHIFSMIRCLQENLKLGFGITTLVSRLYESVKHNKFID